jgi:cytosine/adenosine deaminase-related metal-dependent hydrolase
VDPTTGKTFALGGRVVSMDPKLTVLKKGVVYVTEGRIAAVEKAGVGAPPGFEDVEPLDTGGTIYPGLIELHNHLSYNALTLWQVPRKFTNRGQWGSGSVTDYRRLVSGPMKVLGPDPEVMPAIVRYVECKALVAGTTTSQGIALFSNAGARRYYRGNIRNVEETEDMELPEAGATIPDITAKDAEAFLRRIRGKDCYLLHLSEGVDDTARSYFVNLQMANGDWALADSLAGIHCAGLKDKDFAVLARHGVSMVWSPLSNLLLYGQTADVKAARKHKVRMGIGPDWSPSGSKSAFGELKAAHLANEHLELGLKDSDLVAMATTNAAGILRWDKQLGAIEQGKRPDMLVIDGTTGDPYRHLLEARETDIKLVVVAGVARFGEPELVESLDSHGVEKVKIGGQKRLLNLRQATADPIVAGITLADATALLTKALSELKARAKKAESEPPLHATTRGAVAPVRWGLALDELEPTGVELRPRIPPAGSRAAGGPAVTTAAKPKPLSELLGPLSLDPLTVADDDTWLDTIDGEANLPDWMAPGLRRLYAG